MNLRDTVKHVIAEAVNVDVYTLTTLTLAAVPRDERARMFEQALPAFIREQIVSARPTSSRPTIENPTPILRASGGSLVPGEASAASMPIVEPPRQGNPSRKVAAIRNDWARQLDAIYSTADGNKRLRDFRYDDLMRLADTCADLARANTVKAEYWKHLASLVVAEGVDTLGEIGEDVLAAAMGGAAA